MMDDLFVLQCFGTLELDMSGTLRAVQVMLVELARKKGTLLNTEVFVHGILQDTL